jgi:GH24 family phage-related lysozyme (muramidase)
MSHNSRDLDKLQRGFTKLVGPAKALRQQIEKNIVLAAAGRGGGPAKLEAQIVKEMVKVGQAGWVNPIRTGKATLVQRGTGCVLKGANGQNIQGTRFAFKSTPPLSKSRFLSFARSTVGENFIANMYLDDKGNVTVGIGHLVVNLQEAQRLASQYQFTKKGTNARSRAADLANYYNAVKNSGMAGFHAHKLAPLTGHEMSLAEATRLFDDDVDIKLREFKARQNFPEFETYPPVAKLGLVDMGFTLGVRKVRTVYTNFTAAVLRRDWKMAAIQSNRTTVSALRNAEIRMWFREAAKKEPFFYRSSLRA